MLILVAVPKGLTCADVSVFQASWHLPGDCKWAFDVELRTKLFMAGLRVAEDDLSMLLLFRQAPEDLSDDVDDDGQDDHDDDDQGDQGSHNCWTCCLNEEAQ